MHNSKVNSKVAWDQISFKIGAEKNSFSDCVVM